MPNKYPPIPDKEKEKIILRHKELVNQFNSLIGKEEIKENKNLKKELDKEEVIASYHIAREIREIDQKQNRIFDSYASKYPLRDSDDRKWLITAIKHEDTLYAKAYNDKLFEQYNLNPEKLKAVLFKEAISFAPSKIMECKDDKHKLVEFYKENKNVLDMIYVLGNSYKAPFFEEENEAFKDSLDLMSEPLNVISYPKLLASDATYIDFYALPRVNQKQAENIVINAESKKQDFSTHVRNVLESTSNGDLNIAPEAYFNNIKEVNNNIDMQFKKNWLATYEAHTKKDYSDHAISDFSEAFLEPNGATIKIRKDIDILKTRFINNEYMDVYRNKWQERFNKNFKSNEAFNAKGILAKHSGGIFEKMFGSTSNEFKEYSKAFEEYNDPKSNHYLDAKYLKEKGDAYLSYKTKDGTIDIDSLGDTAKKRINLIKATNKTIEESNLIEKEVDKEISKDLPVTYKSFLNDSDLEDSNDISLNESMEKPLKKNNNIIEIEEDEVKL